jgi:hypothetical protein
MHPGSLKAGIIPEAKRNIWIYPHGHLILDWENVYFGMKQLLIVIGILLGAGLVIWMKLAGRNPAGSDPVTGLQIPQHIEFKFHVRPIISDKCFKCHGPDPSQRKAGLRLDIESEALAELKESPGKYAIVPGDPDNSMLVHRIHSEDPSTMMPPPESNLQLTDYDREILEKWIAEGARYQPHWAFIPPEKKPLPEISNKNWPINEIDYFILGKLDEKGLDPSPQASKEQLIRRVSLDLTGLPPSPEEVAHFVNDNAIDAYEALIDRLLKSPAYGERMAQVWLDIARYADSHGYQDDSYRSMWPWRDWVIHAFNTNMSYDQFLTNQIAGDLMPDVNKEKLLATGFNRNHPITQEGGVIDEEYRVAYVSDRTNTLGKGILGITLECAKCHDHKYDPITMKDYYSMYAFFNNVSEKGLQMDAVQAANRKYYADTPVIRITDEDIDDILSFVNKTDTSNVNVMVMNDSLPRQAHVLSRGNYDAPTDPVEPGTPAAILPFPEDEARNRLGLAHWLTSGQNPLTARVYVNRMWLMLFGQGIVKTAEDFGSQGSLPSHPELLDWLAVDFRENQWDIQALLKKMVLSATYRQDSRITPELEKKDPENIYLARGPRYRMDAEMIRDYFLKTSGLLNPEIGGPSVKPYQPPGLWEETNAGNQRGILTRYVEDKGKGLYRRSIYTFWKRTLPPPSMALFDAPNRDICEIRRQVTNTPLQALAVQNDVQVLEASRVLAQTISSEYDPDEAVRQTFKHVLLREPDDKEYKILRKYYNEVKSDLAINPQKADSLLATGQYSHQFRDKNQTAALMLVTHVIYNLDETISIE